MGLLGTTPYNVTIAPSALTAPVATNRYKKTTATYDPNQDMTGQTAYSGVETSAVQKLNDIITNGGYSPQQTQTMVAGAMAPIYDQATAAKKAATEDAYARGLGQSTILANNNTDIDKSVLSQLANITGQVTQQGANMVPTAIQEVQSGQAAALDNQYKKAQLAASLNMNDQQMELAMDQLNNAASQSDADRQLTYQNLQNQYNLSSEQLDLLIQQAENDRKIKESQSGIDLFTSILGSLTGLGGTILGSALKPTTTTT
jgi:hypothetical protein